MEKMKINALTSSEVCEVLKISQSTLYRYEKEGIIVRLPKLRKKMFSAKVVSELAGLDLDNINLIEANKKNREMIRLKYENNELKEKIKAIEKIISNLKKIASNNDEIGKFIWTNIYRIYIVYKSGIYFKNRN